MVFFLFFVSAVIIYISLLLMLLLFLIVLLYSLVLLLLLLCRQVLFLLSLEYLSLHQSKNPVKSPFGNYLKRRYVYEIFIREKITCHQIPYWIFLYKILNKQTSNPFPIHQKVFWNSWRSFKRIPFYLVWSVLTYWNRFTESMKS